MSKASQELALMRRLVRNVDIAWEHLLFINYSILLRRSAGIVDVGANVGLHCKRFLKDLACAHLAAFEPIPELQVSLQRDFGDFAAFKLHPCALGDASGHVRFFVKRRSYGESGLRQKTFYGDRRNDDLDPIQVPIERLDDVDLGFKPDFIKVDIEGGEVNMLRGAAMTIESSRPIISVEYGVNGYSAFGHQPDALVKIAETHRYQIYDVLGNKFASAEEFLSCQSTYYWDYILAPDERTEELSSAFAKIGRATKPLPIVGRVG